MREVKPVLVVDDSSDVREALVAFVRDMGLPTIDATNGQEALSAARREKPRLIILDLAMPTMDGWHFRGAQQADPVLASVPVIVVTGEGDAASQAERMGATAGLDKPLDADRLREAVERYR